MGSGERVHRCAACASWLRFHRVPGPYQTTRKCRVVLYGSATPAELARQAQENALKEAPAMSEIFTAGRY